MKYLTIVFITLLYVLFVNCDFYCPEGSQITQASQPTKNGCGPEVTDTLTKLANDIGKTLLSKFQSCCDTHDVCYGTCVANSRNSCDSNFKSCMLNQCKSVNAILKILCKTQANSIYETVNKLGSKYFDAAQNSSCKCA
jgi:hypothetical protein